MILSTPLAPKAMCTMAPRRMGKRGRKASDQPTLVVVVVARSVSIVVIQVQVLVRRQVQEHRCRWGVLPEDPWFEVCWVGGTLEEMGSGVRGAAAVWACVSGVGGGVYSV